MSLCYTPETPYCKSTILQLKKKKERVERGKGNEKSLRLVLKGKDRVTRKMNMAM